MRMASPRVPSSEWTPRSGGGPRTRGTNVDAATQLSEAGFRNVGHVLEELGLLRADSQRKERALMETEARLAEAKGRAADHASLEAAQRKEIRKLHKEVAALAEKHQKQSVVSSQLEDLLNGGDGRAFAGVTLADALAHRRTLDENAQLTAAIGRYDRAVASLRNVIMLLLAKTDRAQLAEQEQEQLQQVMADLLRLKNESQEQRRLSSERPLQLQHVPHAPPPAPDSEAGSSSRDGDSHGEGRAHLHPDLRDVRVMRDERQRLRVENQRLQAQASAQARQLAAQQARIDTLCERIEQLQSAARDQARRWGNVHKGGGAGGPADVPFQLYEQADAEVRALRE